MSFTMGRQTFCLCKFELLFCLLPSKTSVNCSIYDVYSSSLMDCSKNVTYILFLLQKGFSKLLYIKFSLPSFPLKWLYPIEPCHKIKHLHWNMDDTHTLLALILPQVLNKARKQFGVICTEQHLCPTPPHGALQSPKRRVANQKNRPCFICMWSDGARKGPRGGANAASPCQSGS